jgi:ABC-type siderophore export system fused ATPase/permease subunit
LIGKGVLALAAAAMIAAAAALFVGAAGFALYSWLKVPLGEAGGAGVTAGAAFLFLLLVFLVVTYHKQPRLKVTDTVQTHAHALISTFSHRMKEQPVLTLGLAALTGLIAVNDRDFLKDLWIALLHHKGDKD